mgnify:CR=1 FL=1
MCFNLFGNKGDPAADARRREEERQGRIAAGKSQINSAFEGFDDDFYGGRETSALKYYRPQLEDQYPKARRDLTLALARSGNLQSSTATRRFGDLNKRYKSNLLDIGSKAKDISTNARNRVEQTRGELFNQLSLSADPSAAANSAISRAQILGEDQAFSPLGQLFQNAAAGIGAYKTGEANRNIERTIYPVSAGSGSVRTVS